MKSIFDIVTNNDNLNLNIKIYGWIKKIRKLGSLIFLDVYDSSGMVQILVKDDSLFYDNVYSTPKESIIEVIGILKNRKSINNEIPTGHVEIILESFTLISKSKNTPFLITNDTDGLEEIRLKYRYLDLRRPSIHNNLIKRSDFIHRIRDFLHRKDFIEIETPILSKITPEGANGYLVHLKNDMYFSLSQSPQIYKQLLMVSGFMKYFQIAKCFRNEDLRLDRQPEFSQLDMEFSFVNEEYIFNLVETLLKDVLLKTLNLNLKIPFKKIDYDDSIRLYGTDKPNIGYEYKIFNCTDYFEHNTIFSELINKGREIKSIIISDYLIEKENLKKIEKYAKDNGAKSLISIVYDNGIIGGSLMNKIDHSIIKNIFNKENINKGTIFFENSEGFISNKILGSIRNAAIDILNIPPKEKYNFVWVVNWPLFEFSKEEKKYVSLHHPFTSPSKESEKVFFDNNIENLRARSYDIVLNGFEIGGGSIRIHKKNIQERVFEILNIKEKVYKEEFGFLLEAFEYGFPPHGGIALGIDRILMIILNTNSIRDVIAFPKNSSGVDLMINAPSERK